MGVQRGFLVAKIEPIVNDAWKNEKRKGGVWKCEEVDMDEKGTRLCCGRGR